MTERNRSKNFTERECLELIRGVQKYAHVIECRQPGKYRNYDKMSTWEAIAREFNKHAINPRNAIALRSKWKKDKSNVRDYIQYLKTSQSRSGRPPKEIPKPRYMHLIAKTMGIECAALEPPEPWEFDDLPDVPVTVVKSEPIDDTNLSFEEIMVNEGAGQFNYEREDSNQSDSYREMQTQAQGSVPLQSVNNSKRSDRTIQRLQIELLKRQIEVQELMATELKVKIDRNQQLMKMEAEESALRCQEIAKRLQN